MFLSSFPQQAHDPDTLLKQLVVLFTGLPRQTLKGMVDPRIGAVSSGDFPTLAAAKKWLDQHLPRVNSAEHQKFLPEPEPEYVSPEERARRVQMLKNVAKVIKETVKTNCVGRPDDTPEKIRKRQQERAQRCQAPDTPEQRSKLLQTELMQSGKSSAA